MALYLIANCIASVALITLTLKKIIGLKRPKPIQKVMLSSSASGCCNRKDYSTVNNCPNRYCVQKNLREIVQAISQSQHSICLASFTLNLSDVEKALKDAYKRDVKIRIITTGASMNNLSGSFPRLANSGISIRFPRDVAQLFHHKFCIVDGAILLSGSMNWTLGSFTSNWDNYIFTTEKELIEKYQTEFDSLWRKLGPLNMPKQLDKFIS